MLHEYNDDNVVLNHINEAISACKYLCCACARGALLTKGNKIKQDSLHAMLKA